MITPELRLGKFIRELRLEKGLNLQELAKKVGVNYVHISYIEKGLRIPSEELLVQLAKVLAKDAKHEKEIREKMLFLLTQIKAPNELKHRLMLKSEDEIVSEISMPEEFISMLKKDIQGINPSVFEKFGINYKLIQKVLDGKAQLSRIDVIKIAHLLHKNVDEYLLKAGYIPEEFNEFLEKQSVFTLMRSLRELPAESLDSIITAIETILKTFKKNQSQKRQKNEE
ncbi:hypothetical protein TdN_19670 [Thermodesulfovibrio sp. TK110]